VKVLVIGGTRFIGPAVVKRLLEAGWEVCLFHRGQTKAELPQGVEEILGDRREFRASARALGKVRPDIVLDMIPRDERDAEGVMETFRGVARRVVAVSSQDVYRAYGRLIGTEPGPPDPTPLTEESPLREKLRPYRGETPRAEDDPARWMDDYDKIPAEKLFLGDPELPGTVLRLPMVYGERDYQHRLLDFARRMSDGRPAILLDEVLARWRSSWAYVGNVGEAVSLAVTKDEAAGRTYNVSEQPAYSTEEWVRQMARVMGWTGEVVVLPGERLPESLRAEGAMEQDMVADSSRIRKELGYAEPVPLDEALSRTIDWELANPPAGAEERFDYAAEDRLLTEL
jgi:nucleoside-diphosphate-sugar epimerase